MAVSAPVGVRSKTPERTGAIRLPGYSPSDLIGSSELRHDQFFAFTRFSASKVRLLSFRDVGLLVVVVLVPIFRTDAFRYSLSWRIGQGCGPGRREDAFILDRHV